METYYQPSRIYFQCDALNELPSILQKYGKKVFMVTTSDAPLQPLYQRVKNLCNDAKIELYHFDQVTPNPTVEMVDNAHRALNQFNADVIVALGGGSSIDTAKVLALTNQQDSIDWSNLFTTYDSPYVNYGTYSNDVLPLIAIPTTSGTGSQVTQAAVISSGSDKCTIYHPQCMAKEVILDPNLVATLPLKMSMATGFDAFTHAFESYINTHHSVYSRFDSQHALSMIYDTLPKLYQDINNIEYRKTMSLSDTLAGKALANSGADIPHPLSEIIGGITHMTHGVALACVFVPFIEVMKDKHRDDFNAIAHLLDPNIKDDGADQLANMIASFMESIGMNVTLKNMGVSEQQFQQICASPILHHLPFASYDQCLQILQKAYQ